MVPFESVPVGRVCTAAAGFPVTGMIWFGFRFCRAENCTTFGSANLGA